MNYFNSRSFFIWMFNEALSGIKSGEYKVDENGVLLHDTYLNVVKFNLIDDNTKEETVRYLIVSYQEGMKKPKVSLPETLLGPGTDSLVADLHVEIQKRFEAGNIKDKWGEYYHNSLKEYIKNKENE